MVSRTVILLFTCYCASHGDVITETPMQESTESALVFVEPSLGEAYDPSSTPDPFVVAESASMAMPLAQGPTAEVNSEPGPLIPREVWISVGLMAASFLGYLWLAAANLRR